MAIPPQITIMGMPDDIMLIMRRHISMNISWDVPSVGIICRFMPAAVISHFIRHIAMGIMPPIIGICGIGIMPPIIDICGIGIMPPIIGIIPPIMGICIGIMVCMAAFISLFPGSVGRARSPRMPVY
jgi:hypothetical protein